VIVKFVQAFLVVVAAEFGLRRVAVLAADAPRLSAKGPQPLGEFLRSLPGSLEMQLFWGLMIAGTAGMLAHYLLKWARDEIKGGLFPYFAQNVKSTALSFFSYVGIAVTAIASGAFTGEYGGFVGWKIVFWMGITNGFTIDAIVNRTGRAEWSPVERLSKTEGVKP
jgi:hypothetical protein